MSDVGQLLQIVRYPVKSMAGTAAESAFLGWHGLAGDRRFAFRRLGEPGGFPWLSASRLPELLLYRPEGLDEASGEPLPTHVRTPGGSRLELRDPALAAELGARCGGGLQLMQFKHGIFDDGAVSLISPASIAALGREAGLELDPRRFRANLLIGTPGEAPYTEDAWLGRTLVFGDPETGPALAVTQRDPRCAMLNLDPDTAAADPRVMKTAVRLRGNEVGVYATVLRTGTLRVGDRVSLLPGDPQA